MVVIDLQMKENSQIILLVKPRPLDWCIKIKVEKTLPTRGIEPGPLGWKAATMTTRPACLCYGLTKINIICHIFSYYLTLDRNLQESTLSLEKTSHNGVKHFLVCCQLPTAYCLHIYFLTYYTGCKPKMQHMDHNVFYPQKSIIL